MRVEREGAFENAGGGDSELGAAGLGDGGGDGGVAAVEGVEEGRC